MKNSKFAPLAIFAFTTLLLVGCTGQPQTSQEPKVEPQIEKVESQTAENKEPQNIEYDGLIVTPRCQDVCLAEWGDINFDPDYSLKACHILCEEGMK